MSIILNESIPATSSIYLHSSQPTQLDTNNNEIKLNTQRSLYYVNELTNSNYIHSKDDDEDNRDDDYNKKKSDQVEKTIQNNLNLLFSLIRQFKPGMNLASISLPTFLLEPKSFLEKLAELYYHSDILAEACNNNDPFERIKLVTKFYLSAFYKQPRELKKPYNPVLGELYRTYWYDPKTQSKTFYIAEQVSHHPPVSSFYVTNRKVGFCIYGSVTTRTKFDGQSVTAHLNGITKIVFLTHNEEYEISFPYVSCKGFLTGRLNVELGGSVKIECNKTDYITELDFKLKPRSDADDLKDLIEGRINCRDELVAVLDGKWNEKITIREKYSSPKEATLWNSKIQTVYTRLKRFHVSLYDQTEYESEKLWHKVSQAIRSSNESKVAEEKSKIEMRQREKEADRKLNQIEYYPKLFIRSGNEWIYKYLDLRPWNAKIDLFQYESNFKILTRAANKHESLEISSSLVEQTKNNLTKIELEQSKSSDLILKFHDLKQRLKELDQALNQMNTKFRRNSASLSTVSEETED